MSECSARKFSFDNIYLPDSINNEPESHGYVAYRIKPIDDIQLGDIVLNQASIYFDFNLPVITNTASTEFVEEISHVYEESFLKGQVSPNPATNILYLRDLDSQNYKISMFINLILNNKNYLNI